MNLKSAAHISRRSRYHRSALVTWAVISMALAILLGLAGVAWAFPDVSTENPYYEAITDLANRHIVTGYENGNFGPADPVRRMQFAKMVVLTGDYDVSPTDACPFGDVPAQVGDDPLYPSKYVAVCAANGITIGRTPTTFDPWNYISRYQVVSMVIRAVNDLQPGLLEPVPSGFTGAWQGDPTHGANAALAEHNGLLAGLSLTTLAPYGNMSRGEVAQVLHNLLGLLPSAGDYSLSVNALPAAGGSVTRDPNQTTYAAGSTVVLTPEPAVGYGFSEWSGDASGSTYPLAVVMDSNKTINAVFVPVSVSLNLTVQPAGGGWVTRSPDQAGYPIRSSVVLTAVPADGYVFNGWGGDASGSTNPLTLVMDHPKSVTALFAPAAESYEDVGIGLYGSPAIAAPFIGNVFSVFGRLGTAHLGMKTFNGAVWDSAWEDLGIDVKDASRPGAVYSQSFVHLDVVVRGTDDHLWYGYKTATGWEDWADLGGTLYSSPAICSPHWGDLAVFWRTADGSLRMKRCIDGDWEAGAHVLGGAIAGGTDPAVVSPPSQNGDIHVFIKGTNGNLWHRKYNGTTLEWTSWSDLGVAIASSPSAAANGNSLVEAYYRGSSNQLYRIVGASDGAHWMAPELVGNATFVGSPAAAGVSTTRTDVVLWGEGYHLLHSWSADNGETWNP